MGNRANTTASTTVMPVPMKEATPMARLMLLRSPLPQYWLTRMPRPLWTPNTMLISRNTGTLAEDTAAISSFPSWLTMKVSISPSEKVMRFCRMTGRDSIQSRL